MKVALVGGFCEMEELCHRAGHEISHIISFGEDDAYISQGNKDIPLVIVPDGDARKKMALRYSTNGFKFATIVANTADVSVSAVIGDGSVIAEHVIVNAVVKIGRFVKVNAAAVVMHECEICDFATIAPRAVLLGRVKVGEGVYIGANATVLPGVKIGRKAVIGAGAVVTHDVPDGETWVGVPARKLEK